MVPSERSCHKQYKCAISVLNMKALSFLERNLWPRLKFLFTHTCRRPHGRGRQQQGLWHKLPRHSSQLAKNCGMTGHISCTWVQCATTVYRLERMAILVFQLARKTQTLYRADFAKVEIFYRTFGLVKCNISQDRIKICQTEIFKWNFDK